MATTNRTNSKSSKKELPVSGSVKVSFYGGLSLDTKKARFTQAETDLAVARLKKALANAK